MSLLERSVEVLKKGQAPSGAFPAAAGFPVYNYCWLRDGTFIAYALDRAGEHEAAGRYYLWAERTILAHAHKLKLLKEKKARREQPEPDTYLHTRYTLEGREGTEPWGNFQLDGYGTYLWGLACHAGLAGRPELLKSSAAAPLVADYLLENWNVPCLDCWEECEGYLHPSTLAAVAGGLQAVQESLPDERTGGCLKKIKAILEKDYVIDGHFTKLPGREGVDANLLWLAVPFDLYPPSHPLMVATVARLEEELCDPGGGIHRYRADSFYGGGQWVLLTAWLGWYYARAGRLRRATELLSWVESQFDAKGYLPEQVPQGLYRPEEEERWTAGWGKNASPLYWSHAMHIILREELKG